MTVALDLRSSALNNTPIRAERSYVLYWMIAQRRVVDSFALQRAVEWAMALSRPLLIFEALRCDYPWASERLHRFVLDGMAVNQKRCSDRGVSYFPWVESVPHEGNGLLEALAHDACLVVTDEFPSSFFPQMVSTAAQRLDVRLVQVDGVGLLPLRSADRAYTTASSFRRHVQRTLPSALQELPLAEPLSQLQGSPPARLSAEVLRRWPAAAPSLLNGSDPELLRRLPIDHAVPPTSTRGGSEAAEAQLAKFLEGPLDRYASGRNHPDAEAESGLSPYLHFGHIAPHRVVAEVLDCAQPRQLSGPPRVPTRDRGFRALLGTEVARSEPPRVPTRDRQAWSPAKLSRKVTGSRSGWWGLDEAAEAFLDQVVTWRELSFNFAFHRFADHESYESLPDWARTSLERHADDPREFLYSLETLSAAQTHDALWNAAQRQLVHDGKIHNALRMLWGKNILAWTEHPRQALEAMVELNNRFALDGRDPNSVAGIFWILGRFDRPWGPRRAVFGTVRCMTTRSAMKKLQIRRYLERYGPAEDQQPSSSV